MVLIAGIVLSALVAGAIYGMAEGLHLFAWEFVIYMIFRLIQVGLTLPKARSYRRPEVEIPGRITQDDVPELFSREGEEYQFGENLIRVIVRHIKSQGDTLSIHSLVSKQMQSARREVAVHYGAAASDYGSMPFVGMMGTVVGMMAFLGDTGAVLETIGSGTELDLSELNLAGLGTAFLTTFIGLAGKQIFGTIVERRRATEAKELLGLETWLQDNVLAVLYLPSSVTTSLLMENIDDLARPLIGASAQMATTQKATRRLVEEMAARAEDQTQLVRLITRVISPALRRLGTNLLNLDGMGIRVEYIDGGMRLLFDKELTDSASPDLRRLVTPPPASEAPTDEPAPPRSNGPVAHLAAPEPLEPMHPPMLTDETQKELDMNAPSIPKRIKTKARPRPVATVGDGAEDTGLMARVPQAGGDA